LAELNITLIIGRSRGDELYENKALDHRSRRDLLLPDGRRLHFLYPIGYKLLATAAAAAAESGCAVIVIGAIQ
jgi:hypothetical protein